MLGLVLHEPRSLSCACLTPMGSADFQRPKTLSGSTDHGHRSCGCVGLRIGQHRHITTEYTLAQY